MTVQILNPRQVPLGGQRAIEVRRTLPNRERSFVGAWCFVDHYGPEDLTAGGTGMDVAPHPHTGLQTVSWLFDGVIEHRDSNGVHDMVRPSEMNLMTSGDGVTHSEVTTPDTTVLAGVQLWVALPEAARNVPRAFDHHAPELKELPGGQGRVLVFIGELPGVDVSPVKTYSPLLGVELRLDAGAEITLDVGATFEHAILVDTGAVTFEQATLERGDMGIVDAGPNQLHITVAVDAPARLVLLGGEPFEEEIVMWWNFIGRSHDDITEAREAYEAGSERFGHVDGYAGRIDRIPAPPLPPVRLKPRNRRGKNY